MCKKVASLFLLLITLFIATGSLVFAQQNQQKANIDITVSPFVFDYTYDPGSTIHDKVRIRNNSNNTVALRIDLKLMVPDAKGSITLKDSTPQQDDSLNWFKFDSTKFTIKPQEWTEVPFTITVPKDAAFGYYWAINVNQDLTNTDINNTAKITGAAAIPVLLNVKRDGAKAEAVLNTFKTDKSVYEYLPADFTTTIANTGNVHIKPHGNIFIRNGSKDIAILDVNQTEGRIIPQAKRTFTASWDDGFVVREPVMLDDKIPKVDKNGKPETKLTFHWNKITSMRFGHYTAKLFMIFDNGTRDVTLEGTTSFWVIPYTAISIMLVTIVAIALLIRFILKLYIKRVVKKQQSI